MNISLTENFFMANGNENNKNYTTEKCSLKPRDMETKVKKGGKRRTSFETFLTKNFFFIYLIITYCFIMACLRVFYTILYSKMPAFELIWKVKYFIIKTNFRMLRVCFQ